MATIQHQHKKNHPIPFSIINPCLGIHNQSESTTNPHPSLLVYSNRVGIINTQKNKPFSIRIPQHPIQLL